MPTALGTAIAIDGIARGSTEAVIARTEQMSVIDLTDASEQPLVEADERARHPDRRDAAARRLDGADLGDARRPAACRAASRR